jgi:Ca-activated chloride channel family protein
MTSLRERDRLHAAVGELQAQGSAGLEDGLVTGYRVAREGYREGATNGVVLPDVLARLAAAVRNRIEDGAVRELAELIRRTGS